MNDRFDSTTRRLRARHGSATLPVLSLVAAFITALFAAGAVSSGAETPPSPAVAHDPIEGKWWGQAGSPRDRIDVGFEFKRNGEGKLRAYLYEPVGNFYALELPGSVDRKDATYTIAEYGTTLTLRGDTLEGTYLPTNEPALLRRTDTLPSDPPVPSPPPGPAPKWIARLGAGAVYAPAAARDGVVYVGTTGGIFHAIRESDGTWAWMFAAGAPIYGAALATDDRVFFVADNGWLFALDRATGKEVWRYALGGADAPRILSHRIIDKVTPRIGEFDFENSSPRPELADGVLYVGSGDGSFHAVDAATGKRVWRFEAPENGKPPEELPWDPVGSNKIRTDALIDGDHVIFGSFGHKLRALDRKTGAEVWQKDFKAELSSAPALVDGKIVVGSRGGMLYALEPATAKVLWRMIFWGSAVESPAVPAGGSLFYIGSSDMRRVSLIDAKDARVVWRADVFGLAWARPAAADGRVYASVTGYTPYDIRHVGSLTALDAATGKMAWRWTPPATNSLVEGFAAPPIVDGGLVIAGGLDGDLYAFPAEGKDRR